MSYKVMLLGMSGAGKTSIARRLKFNAFETKHKSTLGMELYSLSTQVGEKSETIVLWDTDGNFGDMIFERVFLKGASAAIVVADVSNNETIEAMVSLAESFRQAMPGAPVCTVLNKSDLAALSEQRMAQLRSQCPNLHICSAKTGEGVMQAIELLANQLS